MTLEAASTATDTTTLQTAHSSYDERCTVFMRDLPIRCRENEVVEALVNLGWGDVISFVSLPLRPSKPGRAQRNRGYAFAQFISPQAAEAFLDEMTNGFRINTRASSKFILVESTRGSEARSSEAREAPNATRDFMRDELRIISPSKAQGGEETGQRRPSSSSSSAAEQQGLQCLVEADPDRRILLDSKQLKCMLMQTENITELTGLWFRL